MKTLAIITARGGSKRIPRKNIKKFVDKPIILYSIEAAIKSGVFSTVMVSTDDEEIAAIAKEAGAEVPFFRSKETANDFATTADVISEVLESYEKLQITFEKICCIYPTAPFVSSIRLKEAMEILRSGTWDTVMPVVRFSFPPQRALIIKENRLKPKWPEYMPMRSQDLEPFYHDCGQFYCLDCGSFLTQRKIVMEQTYPMEISELEVQDIDTEIDWKLAELKYMLLSEESYESNKN